MLSSFQLDDNLKGFAPNFLSLNNEPTLLTVLARLPRKGVRAIFRFSCLSEEVSDIFISSVDVLKCPQLLEGAVGSCLLLAFLSEMPQNQLQRRPQVRNLINWNSSATSIHAGKFSLEHSNTHQRTDFRTNGNAKLFWGCAKELWAWCCDRWDVMYAITVIYITLPWIHYPQPRTHSQNIFLVGWILQSLPARPIVDIFFCNARILKAPECWSTTHSKKILNWATPKLCSILNFNLTQCYQELQAHSMIKHSLLAVTKLCPDNSPSPLPPVNWDGSDLPGACAALRPEWSGWIATIREVVAEGRSRAEWGGS